jgi:hypothetical protein
MAIGSDMFEKLEDVRDLSKFLSSVGGIGGGSAELEGDVMICLYVMEAFRAVVVRWTASRNCMMAASKAGRVG